MKILFLLTIAFLALLLGGCGDSSCAKNEWAIRVTENHLLNVTGAIELDILEQSRTGKEISITDTVARISEKTQRDILISAVDRKTYVAINPDTKAWIAYVSNKVDQETILAYSPVPLSNTNSGKVFFLGYHAGTSSTQEFIRLEAMPSWRPITLSK